jgi:hypothetical protein
VFIIEKNRYLRRLRFALCFGFNRQERGEIIADYEGFFERGREEGKDEAEICAELGEPRKAARDLAREAGKHRLLSVIFSRNTLRFAVLILATAFPFIFYTGGYVMNLSRYVLGAVSVTVSVCGLMWFAFSGKNIALDFGKKARGLYTGHILTTIISAAVLGFYLNSNLWLRLASDYILPAYFGGIVHNSLRVLLLCVFLIYAFAARAVFRGEGERIPLLINSAGSLFMIWLCEFHLMKIDLPETFKSNFPGVITAFVMIILYTALSWVWLKRKASRAEGVSE